jgi:hypothetical protein
MLAEALGLDISGYRDSPASSRFDQPHRFFRIILFLRKMSKEYVSTLLGKAKRNRPAYTAVGSRNERRTSVQFAAARIAGLAIVRLRLQIIGTARRNLFRLGERRGGETFPGIGGLGSSLSYVFTVHRWSFFLTRERTCVQVQMPESPVA